MRFEEIYKKAKYTVLTPTPVVFMINHRSLELDEQLKKAKVTQAAFITAWNPKSELKEQKENDYAQNQLKKEVLDGKLPYLLGYGEDSKGAWKEESLLLMGVNQEYACTIGRKYEQNAIVWLELNQAPQLVFLLDESTSDIYN